MSDAGFTGPCGDCSSTDCNWVSLNRGLFLCADCCSVHRSLGPQYSRIKSIKHSVWSPPLLKLISTLAAGPANNVWEHLLRNPNKSDEVMKKPVATDSIDVKTRFITAKHVQLQFVLRRKSENLDERNEELHSTVRTGDVGTALRLIAAGADPNFFHPERGTRPMHVACKYGQALQVELLFVHGAHVNAPDYLGQSPAEHAVAAGFKDLAVRAQELRYQVTDRLSYFVCGETPSHVKGRHILIPTAITNFAGQEENIKNLTPPVLEQLAADLYDEVERREIERILVQHFSGYDKMSLAFLPINAYFPSVRNQTRQKFARLADAEFAALVTLVLKESKRRHLEGSSDLDSEKDVFLIDEATPLRESRESSPTKTPAGIIGSDEDDEFPLYDSVASDDDVVMSEVHTVEAHANPPALQVGVQDTKNVNSAARPISNNSGTAAAGGFLAKLAEERIAELEKSNLALKYELKMTQQMLGNFMKENLEKPQATTGITFTDADRLNSNVLPNTSSSRGSGDMLQLRRSSSGLLETLKKSRPGSIPEKMTDAAGEAAQAVGSSRSLDKSSLDEVSFSSTDYLQSNTAKIVELIKILIEYAQASDYEGVKLSTGKIYDNASRMSTVLMRRHQEDGVILALQNVLQQVLRLKTEAPLLRNSQVLVAATLAASESHKSFVLDGNAAQLYVQKVRQLCFDVGASLKKLVAAIGVPAGSSSSSC